MPIHPRGETSQHDIKCPTATTKLSYGNVGIKFSFSGTVYELYVRNKKHVLSLTAFSHLPG